MAPVLSNWAVIVIVFSSALATILLLAVVVYCRYRRTGSHPFHMRRRSSIFVLSESGQAPYCGNSTSKHLRSYFPQDNFAFDEHPSTSNAGDGNVRLNSYNQFAQHDFVTSVNGQPVYDSSSEFDHHFLRSANEYQQQQYHDPGMGSQVSTNMKNIEHSKSKSNHGFVHDQDQNLDLNGNRRTLIGGTDALTLHLDRRQNERRNRYVTNDQQFLSPIAEMATPRTSLDVEEAQINSDSVPTDFPTGSSSTINTDDARTHHPPPPTNTKPASLLRRSVSPVVDLRREMAEVIARDQALDTSVFVGESDLYEEIDIDENSDHANHLSMESDQNSNPTFFVSDTSSNSTNTTTIIGANNGSNRNSVVAAATSHLKVLHKQRSAV